MQTELGSYIKQLRTQRGLSLNQLAQKAGVSQPTLSRWEAGKTLPRLTELDAVLNALQAAKSQQRHALELINAPRAMHRVRKTLFNTGSPLDRRAGVSGDLLRAMRLRKRLTLEDTARKIHVTKGTLSRWENGETSPSAEKLHALCSALDAHTAELAAMMTGCVDAEPFIWGRKPTLEEESARLDILERRVWQGDDTLLDLQVLAMEARLLPSARSSTAALHLLSRLWSLYSQWLCWQARSQECVARAEQVMELVRANIPVPRSDLSRAVLASQFALSAFSVERSLECFQTWTSYLSAPRERLLMEMERAFVIAAAIRQGRTKPTPFALGELRTLASKIPNAFEAHFMQRLTAEVALCEGRYEEALGLLPPLPSSMHSRVEELFLRIEILLALSKRTEAAARLSEVCRLIQGCDNQEYRRQAAVFSKRV